MLWNGNSYVFALLFLNFFLSFTPTLAECLSCAFSSVMGSCYAESRNLLTYDLKKKKKNYQEGRGFKVQRKCLSHEKEEITLPMK